MTALDKLATAAAILSRKLPDNIVAKHRKEIREILTTQRQIVEPFIPENQREIIFAEDDSASNETYFKVFTEIERRKVSNSEKFSTHGPKVVKQIMKEGRLVDFVKMWR